MSYKQKKVQSIKTAADILQVANLLGANLKKQSKNTYAGNCPTGHASESGACFKLDTEKQLYKCFNCNSGGNVISLVMAVMKVEFSEAVKWLRDKFSPQTKFNYELKELTDEEKDAAQKKIEQSLLFEEIYTYGKNLLYKEEGKEALDYLLNERKYDIEILKQTEWIYFPTEKQIMDYLIEKHPDRKMSIVRLKLQGCFMDKFRIAIPYRDSNGNITGFMKRSSSSKGLNIVTKDNKEHENVRWDSTPGIKKDNLFGLCDVPNEEETLLIVEGIPDTAYLSRAGISNITAVSQGSLGEKQLNSAIFRKIKNIIIAFDNDGVGTENSAKAIEMILRESRIKPYIIDPVKYGIGIKDPDEYFKKNGVEELKKLFNDKVEDGIKWILTKKVSEQENPNKIKTESLKEELFDLLSRRTFEESYLKELFEIIKNVIGKSFNDFKKTLEANKKVDVNRLVKQIIVPITDMTSNSRGYYDSCENEFYPGVKTEVLKDILVDHNLELPKNLPAFRVIFDPHKIDERFSVYGKTLNLFSPTKYMLMKPTDEKIELDVKCPRIYSLIKNLIPIKEELEHFLNWLAYAFTKREKMRTAFVFKGAQGSGKNLFFEVIIRPLFGEKQTMVVDDDRLQSDYNGFITNKLFIAFNEVGNDSSDSRRGVKSKLKAIITEQKILINQKYINTYEADNLANVMFFTNEILPVLLEEGDRRYNIIETGGPLKRLNSFKANPNEFINDMKKELSNFAQFLHNYKIDEQKIDIVIENQAKEDIKELSMNKYQKFATRLKAGDLEWFDDNMEVKQLTEINRVNIKEKKIEKREALSIFCYINNDYSCTLTKLTQMLKQYGIQPKRVRTQDSKDVQYYVWS